jgi:hypothetical protein
MRGQVAYLRSVIIHDFHLLCAAQSLIPDKANTPLIIDANAILPYPIAFQELQPISRYGREFGDGFSGL